MADLNADIQPESDPSLGWSTYSESQQAALIITNLLTLSRPIIAGLVTIHGLDQSHEWTWGDTALTSVAAVTDLEGNILRHFGIHTNGGELRDRLADRLATYPLEYVLVKRGEMPKTVFAVNAMRTIGVIAARQFARSTSEERPDFTNKPTKVSAVLRQASNIVAVSPWGAKHPRFRTATQITAAAAGVATGIMDVRKLLTQTSDFRYFTTELNYLSAL